jgi:hypothetical protein
MNIYQMIVSEDANRCGSPSYNTRLKASPASAAMFKHSNRVKHERQKKPIPFEVVTDSELDAATTNTDGPNA